MFSNSPTQEVNNALQQNNRNLGGYDKYLFKERLGLNCLEHYFLKTYRIVPYFSENDKTPNFDGWFEICNKSALETEKIVPVQRFNVQIKTLNKNYCNDNQQKKTEYAYKYSCDTKVLNAVLTHMTKDPTILFLIDPENELIFWQYLSEEFCIQNQPEQKKSFTFYFSDRNQVDNPIALINRLLQINKMQDETYRDKENVKITLLSNNKEVLQQVQMASDFINFFLENEFKFIKNAFFQETWKIGIAYAERNGRQIVGFYRIMLGENDVVIKQYEMDNDRIHFSVLDYENDVMSTSKEYFAHLIDNYFIEEMVKYHISLLPVLALREIVYKELDYQFIRIQQGNYKAGDVIFNGIQCNQLDFDEYKRLKTEGLTTSLSDACVGELQQRKISTISRIWEWNPSCNSGEIEEVPLQTGNMLNGELPVQLPKTIKCIKNTPAVDESIVEEKNNSIFNRNIENFVDDMFNRLDINERKLLNKRTLLSAIHEIAGCDYITSYSWYKLWRIGMRFYSLQYAVPALGAHISLVEDYINRK